MREGLLWLEVNVKTAFCQVEKLEKGLWFVNSLYGSTDKEYVEIWELQEDVPEEEYDNFLTVNGFPVDVVLTIEMSNPDEPDDIIVFSEDLGYFYNTETEAMELLSIREINRMIEIYGGKAFLLIDEALYEEMGEIVPERTNNLVIVTYPFDQEEDEPEGWEV